jgi:carbonic anhydrase/acetyltransferase-like protein (isoleucine patch superfamily)
MPRASNQRFCIFAFSNLSKMASFDFFNILLSIPKTLRFNFHYFPFKTAIKLPVVVSHRTFLRELHGQVEIPTARTAMVKIGFGDVGHYDRKRSRTIWQVSGTVAFGGNASIGHGSKISVRGKVRFGANFNMTAESTIVCAKEITFGDDCLLSWGVLVMDTDEHPLYNAAGDRINPDKEIRLGNHVWVGCKCMLLKGSTVPDNTVVAAGTHLRTAYSGENQVIGGNPPTVWKEDVRWGH